LYKSTSVLRGIFDAHRLQPSTIDYDAVSGVRVPTIGTPDRRNWTGGSINPTAHCAAIASEIRFLQNTSSVKQILRHRSPLFATNAAKMSLISSLSRPSRTPGGLRK